MNAYQTLILDPGNCLPLNDKGHIVLCMQGQRCVLEILEISLHKLNENGKPLSGPGFSMGHSLGGKDASRYVNETFGKDGATTLHTNPQELNICGCRMRVQIAPEIRCKIIDERPGE